MRHKLLMIVLTCLMLSIVCVGAAEEQTYQTLCKQAGLQSRDVIAWLEIPGASITEPIMRRPEDDAYYATHDADGRQNAGPLQCGGLLRSGHADLRQQRIGGSALQDAAADVFRQL